jgi:hypothetical protein
MTRDYTAYKPTTFDDTARMLSQGVEGLVNIQDDCTVSGLTGSKESLILHISQYGGLNTTILPASFNPNETERHAGEAYGALEAAAIKPKQPVKITARLVIGKPLIIDKIEISSGIKKSKTYESKE